MMFSATLSKEIRPVCRKFMQDVSFLSPSPAPMIEFSQHRFYFKPHVSRSPSAHGSVRGRRDQADAARPAAVLLQTEGQRKEPQTLRPARRAGVQPGTETKRLFTAGDQNQVSFYPVL